MVVKAERLLGVDTFELLLAKKGKGGKEKKKPKKEKGQKRGESLDWFERLKRQQQFPKNQRTEKPGRITDFVRALRKPKRKRKKGEN